MIAPHKVGSMLGQRRRRWPNIDTASTQQNNRNRKLTQKTSELSDDVTDYVQMGHKMTLLTFTRENVLTCYRQNKQCHKVRQGQGGRITDLFRSEHTCGGQKGHESLICEVT